jgi:hypothetical protein
MINDLSWVTIGIGACIVVGLFIVVRGFAMPKSFNKKQEQKEELQKKLPPENPSTPQP